MVKRFSIAAVVFSWVLCISSTTSAAIITLNSSTFSSASTEGWYPNSTSAVITSGVADTNFGATAPVLSVTNPAGGGAIARTAILFDTVTLLNTGDYIQAEFDVRVSGLTSGVSRLFQTGLYFDNGTTQPGYYGDLRMSNPGSYAAGFVNGIKSSADIEAVGTKNAGTQLIASPPATSLGTSATKVRHFVLTITKTDTGVDLLYSGNNDTTGTITLTASDAAPYLTFNTLDLNVKGNTVAFNVDNVLVTTNVVPEPSSFTLGAVAVGGLLVFHRRIRRAH